MWQSLGDFDFSILRTYPWYVQKVALKKVDCRSLNEQQSYILNKFDKSKKSI